MAAAQRPDPDRLAREDLAMFINACFASTGQAEYYADARGQSVAIQFLHEYILGNYRRLYARTLAAGINQFNQSQIVVNLLAAGAPRSPRDRAEEGALVAECLRRMPAPRAWRLLDALRERRVNNRRARAVVQEFVSLRPDLSLDAMKFRPRVRAVARHTHARLPGEVPQFLFGDARRRTRPYESPLLDAHRRARTDPEAMYELPYSVAEGFAARHRVPRDEFLRRIEPMLTAGERLRLQASSRAAGAAVALDLRRLDLTRLCLYALSRPPAERPRRDTLRALITSAAERAVRRAPMPLGRVAAVLDRSHSAGGSHEKARRPLALALAVSALLEAASREYRAFWTPPLDDELDAEAYGATDLATPLVDALAWSPDLVVIVSDGYENRPHGGVAEVLRVYRRVIAPPRPASVVHVNPVFDHERFAPRALAPGLATVGLRDADDLFTMLGFARLADGSGTLGELEAWLEARVRRYLNPRGPDPHDLDAAAPDEVDAP